MAKIRIKYRPTAHLELRTLPGVVNALESHGRRILDAANATLPEGVGYRMSSKRGRKGRSPSGRGKGFQGRWAVRIYTSSNHAKYSNAKHNTLVRLLGSR